MTDQKENQNQDAQTAAQPAKGNVPTERPGVENKQQEYLKEQSEKAPEDRNQQPPRPTPDEEAALQEAAGSKSTSDMEKGKKVPLKLGGRGHP